jgi:Tol biopolymer transport system component
MIGALEGPGEYRDLALSRDGTRVAYEIKDPARRRLTSTADEDGAPVWSPDGESLVFAGMRGRTSAVLRESAAGGSEERLLEDSALPQDWSPDGRTVVLEIMTPARGSDLVLFDVRETTLTPYLATPYMEREAQFSPDGKYMAYSSSASRTRQVYVEPIPRDGRRWSVSTGYGQQPRWRRDGRELFYLGSGEQLMAVAVTPSPRGLAFGTPVPLFPLRIRGADVRYHYAVSRDGHRFLVNTVVEDVPGTPINVWMDWLAGVTK